jgi:hypothetical protein
MILSIFENKKKKHQKRSHRALTPRSENREKGFKDC